MFRLMHCVYVFWKLIVELPMHDFRIPRRPACDDTLGDEESYVRRLPVLALSLSNLPSISIVPFSTASFSTTSFSTIRWTKGLARRSRYSEIHIGNAEDANDRCPGIGVADDRVGEAFRVLVRRAHPHLQDGCPARLERYSREACAELGGSVRRGEVDLDVWDQRFAALATTGPRLGGMERGGRASEDCRYVWVEN